jgi:hypothetical protein
MSSVAPARALLVAQAGVTAACAVLGELTGWTFLTLAVAAGAVFVAAALQQTPTWRWYVVGFEGCCVAFGLAALVSAHLVPGTAVAAGALLWLTSASAARAFAGRPEPVLPGLHPAAPSEPVVGALPVPPQPRPSTLDVLPRR